MTIAIECFSRPAQPDCSTADTGPHRARESMLSSSAADPGMRFKPHSTGHAMTASHQRAAPVVVPEGPSAGGGVRSTAVDPGVPLGPGLLATCPVFHGPPVRIARARTIATTMIASVLPLIEPFLF
jgi:hypothetical protein